MTSDAPSSARCWTPAQTSPWCNASPAMPVFRRPRATTAGVRSPSARPWSSCTCPMGCNVSRGHGHWPRRRWPIRSPCGRARIVTTLAPGFAAPCVGSNAVDGGVLARVSACAATHWRHHAPAPHRSPVEPTRGLAGLGYRHACRASAGTAPARQGSLITAPHRPTRLRHQVRSPSRQAAGDAPVRVLGMRSRRGRPDARLKTAAGGPTHRWAGRSPAGAFPTRRPVARVPRAPSGRSY